MSLNTASAYMLRNDGKLIECDVMHPYIKYIPQNSDKKEIESLFNKNIDHLIWFYNNCKNDETKKYITIFAYSVLSSNKYLIDLSSCMEQISLNIPKKYEAEFTYNLNDIESLFLVLNDQLNQEFLRVRTSSRLFGGTNHAIYFRVSSTDFNWFNLIWGLCYENKNWISDVTVSLDPQARESNSILNHNNVQINRLPINDFINLSGNPVFENINNVNNIQKQLRKGDLSLFEIFSTHPHNIHNCFIMLREKYIDENFLTESMRLNPYLKNLIKANMDKIDKCEFLDIYQNAFDLTSSFDCYQTSKFTNTMYEAGIDPLQFTDGIIPECFLFEDIFLPDGFTKIPDNTRGIWEQAFSGCTFDKEFPVIIPSCCLEIREYAFASSTIQKLELNCINRCNIWTRAFDDCSITELWLNELPTNTNFLSHVDTIKYLYLPTDDADVAHKWLLKNIGNELLGYKIKNIISSVTGEVFYDFT